MTNPTFDQCHGKFDGSWLRELLDPGDQHLSVVEEIRNPAVTNDFQLRDVEDRLRRKKLLFDEQLKKFC